MTVGHLRGGGGNIPTRQAVPGGCWAPITTSPTAATASSSIYSGESWNPQLASAAGRPGLNVNAGDYLLAVNGQELTANDDISRLLENTAGKRVVLRVGPDPSGATRARSR